MLLKTKTLLLLTLLSVALTGCAAKQIVLYPITNQDFTVIKKGQPSPIDGYGMSEFYLNEVLQVKLESK